MLICKVFPHTGVGKKSLGLLTKQGMRIELTESVNKPIPLLGELHIPVFYQKQQGLNHVCIMNLTQFLEKKPVL